MRVESDYSRRIRGQPWQLLALVVLVSILAGCAGYRARPGEKQATIVTAETRQATAAEGVTLDELRNEVMRFADRHGVAMHQAVDTIVAAGVTPAQRRMAMQLRILSNLSIYDIALGPDPVTNLLDAVVLASLTHTVVRDHYGPHVFGDPNAQGLLATTRALEEDIWSIADKVMTSTQQDELRALITEWHQKYPKQHYIWGIRLDQFSRQRAAALRQEVRSGGLVSQIAQTRETIDEVRELGERSLWYVQRAPVLARAQVIYGLYEILSMPEIAALLDQSERATASVEKLAEAIDELPEERLEAIDQVMEGLSKERQAFMDQLVENEEAATKVFAELHGTLVASSELIDRLDTFMGKLSDPNKPADPNEKRIDIDDYDRMFVNAAITANEFTKLVTAMEELVAAPEWEQRLPHAVSAITDDVRGTLLWLFIFTAAIIIVFFASLLIYKALLTRLSKGT